MAGAVDRLRHVATCSSRGLSRPRRSCGSRRVGVGRPARHHNVVKALVCQARALSACCRSGSPHATAALLAEQVPRAPEISIELECVLFTAGASMLAAARRHAFAWLRAIDLTARSRRLPRRGVIERHETARSSARCPVVVPVMGAGSDPYLLALRTATTAFDANYPAMRDAGRTRYPSRRSGRRSSTPHGSASSTAWLTAAATTRSHSGRRIHFSGVSKGVPSFAALPCDGAGATDTAGTSAPCGSVVRGRASPTAT